MSSEVFLRPLNAIAQKIQANPRAWRRGAMWLFLGGLLMFVFMLGGTIFFLKPNGKANPGIMFVMLAGLGYAVTGLFAMIGVVFFRFLYQVPSQSQPDSAVLYVVRFQLMFRLLIFIGVFIAIPMVVSTLLLLGGLLMFVFAK